MEWIKCSDRLPERGQQVLAIYHNRNRKLRMIRAVYICKFEEKAWDSDLECNYSEEKDDYYLPAGWYECIDNWSEYMSVVVYEGDITHWQPLPEPPKD